VGAPPATPIRLAVVGAHLEGQPLNGQLTERGAVLVQRTSTAPCYRLYALVTDPPKPGLVRVAAGDGDGDSAIGGAAIEVEVWEMDRTGFGPFVDAVPAPLAIGRVVLADGSDVAGFVCEPVALADAVEITAFGGWRNYLASLS
jgi:allophanate hydrolase